MNQPKVSVVVPAYNAEQFIDECAASVREQTYENWEMFIVDDGSRDRTLPLAEQHASSDPRIRVLTHDQNMNRGVSRSRRLGVEHATGDLIAFLDADDAFQPGKLEVQVAALKQHPECVLCHTGIELMVDEGGWNPEHQGYDQFIQKYVDRLGQYCYHEEQHFLANNPICNSTVLVRRGVLNSIDFGFDQVFQSEDAAMWILLTQHGPFLAIPDRLTRYRQHPASYVSQMIKQKQRSYFAQLELCAAVLPRLENDEIRNRIQSYLQDNLCRLLEHYVPADKQGQQDTESYLASLGLDAVYWRQRALAAEKKLQFSNLLKRMGRRIPGVKSLRKKR